MLQPPSLEHLAICLRHHMRERGIGLRELENEVGISKATLSRACRGKGMSADHYISLVKKIAWDGTIPVDMPS